MPDVQELLRMARELGEAIAKNERTRAYLAAQQAVQKDAAARSLLEEYGRHMGRIRKLELEQKPIEVADKHKVAEYEQEISGNDVLKNLMRSQADYVQLMNQINSAMETPLTATAQQAQKPA